MKIIEIEQRELDYGDYRLRQAQLTDVSGGLVDENTIVKKNGHPVLVYLKAGSKTWNCLKTLEQLKIGHNERSNGLKVQAVTFGFLPRVGMRNDCCTCTKFARDYPHLHAEVASWAQKAEQLIFEHVPEIAGAQKTLIEQSVLPEWRLEGTSLFTSGIINKDYNIVYHLDKANIPSAWSLMTVIKDNSRGGQLVLPEFNLAFECSNESIVIFNGSKHLHGVTPIEPIDLKKPSHRYSVVFYPMKDMVKCLPLKEEMQRIKRIRTEKENRKLTERRSFKK